jgi:asparagine synthase (glutamine-hydrolysing)
MHRGPDSQGSWSSKGSPATVTLVHTRLRIIDLSEAGHQPMTRGSATIVFNGEIYNFVDLRRTLEEDGFEFSSNCDTEVILRAYARWGADCIRRLHGMFAFALWDGDRKELLLARDRVGKKPLFYHFDGQCFCFGSEIKAILATLDRTPDIDPGALHDYLTYLYVPYPKTMFKGIAQLSPGSWLRIKVLDGGLAMESGRYWDPMSASLSSAAMAERDQSSHLQELIADSVRSRLVSDVPLGVLLSGGLDSSAITAMMARFAAEPVRSFSVGFRQDENYDETSFANLVARKFGCEQQVLQADPSCSHLLTKIVWHFDQPFGNPTAILTYILSALTKNFVTVALAGDGGDELFAGYPRYIGAYMSNVPRSLPDFLCKKLLPWIGTTISDDSSGRHQFRRVREFLEEGGMPPIEMYLRWIGYFSPEEKTAMYTPEFAASVGGQDSGDFLRGLYSESEGLDPLNRLAYVDIKSFLCCNVLEYADRMSMAHALELRAPLTDHRLVEFALRLPFDKKFRYGKSKWIFRRAMKSSLPPEVLNKRKLGFNPPMGTWLNGELRSLPQVLLSPKCIRERGVLRPEAVRVLLEKHASGKRDFSLKIWSLIMLEIWFRIYVDGRSAESVQEDIDEAIRTTNRSFVPAAAR